MKTLTTIQRRIEALQFIQSQHGDLPVYAADDSDAHLDEDHVVVIIRLNRKDVSAERAAVIV